MATVDRLRDLVTEQLRRRVDQLLSVVEDGEADFAEVARSADGVGAIAGVVGDIYSDLEHAMTVGYEGGVESPEGDDGGQPEHEEQPPTDRPEERSAPDDETFGDTTKETLLDQARELGLHGRSSMSKDELAQAVQDEQNRTKEELLERARQADIEGRSSMTKEDLRKALRDAGVS
jgi:cobalamin biosynthesis protein CobT